MKKKKDSPDNPNSGHRRRLRDRFMNAGIRAFAPHEIIEFLLTYSIPQKDVKPLAKMLLERCGSVRGVLSALPELLMSQPGVKENSVSLLKFIYALHFRLLEDELDNTDIITSALSAVRYFRARIGFENREILGLIFLDSSCHTRGYEWYHGQSSGLTFFPEDIARSALLHNASGVIVAHNHPNGFSRPSQKDMDSTRELKNYLEKMDIRLVDHIIVTRTAHLSMLNRIGCIFKNYTEPVIDPAQITPDLPPDAFENNKLDEHED